MSKLVLLSAFLAACTSSSDRLSTSRAALTDGGTFGGYGCGADTGSGSGSGSAGSGSDCYDLDDTTSTTSVARVASAFAECTYGGCGSDAGSGSGSNVDPPPDPPHSTITITYDPGNPIYQAPAQTGMHCSIPSDVLATLPIYDGKPAMKSCTLSTYISGSPPNTISTYLDCTNGTGQGGYDYFTCQSTTTFIPPSTSSSGYFSYGKPGGGTPDLPADTCRAWMARAQGICTQTGVQAE